MASNSAVVRHTKEYLLPSCSLYDFASDEIVFIMQSLTWLLERAKWQAIS